MAAYTSKDDGTSPGSHTTNANLSSAQKGIMAKLRQVVLPAKVRNTDSRFSSKGCDKVGCIVYLCC